MRRPLSGTAPALAGLPEPGEVWTWWLDLDIGEAAALEMLPLLNAMERERAARRSGHHRTRFIAARASLRTILGRSLDSPPEQVEFRYGDCGRPDLASHVDAHGLRFNISHSGPLGLVALVRDQRIGVDVERLRPVRNLEGIVRRVLGERDRTRLRALVSPHLETEFFDCWTRKEAVVKALGLGIFGSLELRLGSSQPAFPESTGEAATPADPMDAALDAGAWTILSLTPPVEGFVASVAVDRPVARITDRSVDTRP